MNRHHYLSILILTLLFGYAGLNAEEHDIVVKDRAVVQRCVTDANARNLSVGMPGGFNFCFDPVNCRLDYVWFGEFLDFRSEATGRGGRRVSVLGMKQSGGMLDLPIRIGTPNNVPKAIQFNGYRKDSKTGIPTFLFDIDGVSIEQRVLSLANNQVTIELRFPGKRDRVVYYRVNPRDVLNVETSDNLMPIESGVIEIPTEEEWAQVHLTLKPSSKQFVRKVPTVNGRLLYAVHCMSCHTLDGKKRIGPSFDQLWSSSRNVTRNGKTELVHADEGYIRESILQPQLSIVQGYENANKMVDVRKTLNEKQIEALVEFLMELKPNK